MIFDVHVHYGHSRGRVESFTEELKAVTRQLGVQRCAVFGIGRCRDEVLDNPKGQQTTRAVWGVMNEEVLALTASEPELVTPIAYYRLDQDSPEAIDAWARRGFRGIKFLWPAEDYDHPKYYPVYERASSHKLVMNFHTGLINSLPRERNFNATGARMRVGSVEAIARTFATPVMVSHFGYPEYDVAGALARILPNLYLDISPSAAPTAAPALMREDLKERNLIGRRIPIEKMVFGSDCVLENLRSQIEGWSVLFKEIGLSASDQDLIWYKNGQSLYSL
jgi:predicted TIM-barrel fold metal-dependent hydrolase